MKLKMDKPIKCLIADDEHIAREILESHLAKLDNVVVVASCKNALEAFNFISSQAIDLIFLDINMPEISGLSFAKSITKKIKIIFTTAYRDYAVDGFDLKAVDYLLKPISFERLLQAINKYTDENLPMNETDKTGNAAEPQESLFVQADRKMIKINLAEVRFIESLSDYIKIYLKDKVIVTRETLSKIETRLPHNDFLRVHRSFIVSKNRINSYTSEFVEIDKHQIPISRSYKDEVKRKLEAV